MAKEYDLSEVKSIVLSDTVLSYAQRSVNTQRRQELKSGQIRPEASLDLQQKNRQEAYQELAHFLNKHSQEFERCVLIVHGKKSIAGNPPLIKNLVHTWLPGFPEVLAYTSALARDGGAAAVYVLLQKFAPLTLDPEEEERSSFLAVETRSMERKRRLLEQQAERHLARVNAREHPDQEPSASAGEELQQQILQHPALDSQRFDGVDPNLNPEPPLNSEARKEFDNERREQEMEKQLRLGNMPKFNTAPTPKGP